MTKRTLPTADGISRLFSDLLGRPVTARPSPTAGKLLKEPTMVADYSDTSGDVGATCICDLSAAASLGAALSLVPAARAEANVKAKRLDEVIGENFREVCNVVTTLLNIPSAPGVSVESLSLSQLSPVKPPASADLVARTTSSDRLDLEISVSGYKAGKLALLVV